MVDAHAYHRFVKESEVYLWDGKVRCWHKVFVLLYYLAGKAHSFYTQKVSINEEEWTLPQFYTELFNYCFPINYQMQMRWALARCHQNDKSISEYTHELQELFNMIGNIPEQDKVIKFWNGMWPVIQKGPWQDNFNPEISTLEDVVNQAKIIKILESVAEWPDCAHNQSNKIGSSIGTHTSGQARTRTNATDRSVWSVTFDALHKPGYRGCGQGPRRFHSTGRFQDQSRTNHTPHLSNVQSVSKAWFSVQGRSTTPHRFNSEQRPSSTRTMTTPQLSEKEQEELRAMGKCFNCKETGHLSQNCPKRNIVWSGSQQPPGTATFNLELEPMLGSDPDLSVEVLESLPVGAVSCDIESQNDCTPLLYSSLTKWQKHYPYWNQPGIYPRKTIGDCYAMKTKTTLTLAQPYPGNEHYNMTYIRPELCSYQPAPVYDQWQGYLFQYFYTKVASGQP